MEFTNNTPTLQDASYGPFIPDPSDTDWQYWAKRITSTWQSSVANIIETGRLLIKAKARLQHGEFGDMIAKYLPFKSRTPRLYTFETCRRAQKTSAYRGKPEVIGRGPKRRF